MVLYCYIYSDLELDNNVKFIEESKIVERYRIYTMCEELDINTIIDHEYSFTIPSQNVLDEIEFTKIAIKDN